MYDVNALRAAEFPLTEREIYFNNAAIAPLPRRTCERMKWATEQLAAQPNRFFQDELMPLGERLLARFGKLLNLEAASEIIPIRSTSEAINMVAQSVPWQEGDNVVFCSVEFPSNAYPWLALAQRGVEVRQVPPDGGGLTLRVLADNVDERTRVVAASAIQFFTGHRTNLAAVGAFCRQRGILFVVDAIQALGHMEIDVRQMNIDVLASGGQKSILGAPGIGVLYVRAHAAEEMQPMLVGSNATKNFLHWLDYDLTPLPGAGRFRMGTWNSVGWCGLEQSVKLLQELGIGNVDTHTTGLATKAIAMLGRRGFDVITPPGNGPIVTFRVEMDDFRTDRLVQALQAHHVSVAKQLDAQGNPHIRLSFHAYNTREELHRFESIFCNTYEEYAWD